jgi:hypothetical protein
MTVEGEALKTAFKGFKLEKDTSLTFRLHSRPCDTRSLGQILTIALPVLLGMMVFVWGTGYKVSLYNVKSEASASAPAKLCTRSSDIAKSDVDTAVADHGVVQVRILFALLSLSDSESRAAQPLSSRADLVLVPPAFCLPPTLDRRPPPVEFHLLLA